VDPAENDGEDEHGEKGRNESPEHANRPGTVVPSVQSRSQWTQKIRIPNPDAHSEPAAARQSGRLHAYVLFSIIAKITSAGSPRPPMVLYDHPRICYVNAVPEATSPDRRGRSVIVSVGGRGSAAVAVQSPQSLRSDRGSGRLRSGAVEPQNWRRVPCYGGPAWDGEPGRRDARRRDGRPLSPSDRQPLGPEARRRGIRPQDRFQPAHEGGRRLPPGAGRKCRRIRNIPHRLQLSRTIGERLDITCLDGGLGLLAALPTVLDGIPARPMLPTRQADHSRIAPFAARTFARGGRWAAVKLLLLGHDSASR
jgi:hypothetical protein